MAKGGDIKEGMILEYVNKSNKKVLCKVVSAVHTKLGKGGAIKQTEMYCIVSGTKYNERFRSDENITIARLDEEEFTYLYNDNGMLALMHPQRGDQIFVEEEKLGNKKDLIQDGMVITVKSYEGEVLIVSIPEKIVVSIEEIEPYIKGQTATASYKPAVLANSGRRVMVPPFIEKGEEIVFNTETGEYVERVKK